MCQPSTSNGIPLIAAKGTDSATDRRATAASFTEAVDTSSNNANTGGADVGLVPSNATSSGSGSTGATPPPSAGPAQDRPRASTDPPPSPLQDVTAEPAHLPSSSSGCGAASEPDASASPAAATSANSGSTAAAASPELPSVAGTVPSALEPVSRQSGPAVPRPLGPTSVAMAATRVVMHQLVLPADVNQLGICTGGQVLSWIDVCAGLSAKTLAHGPCVTASVDAVHFLRPCRLGCVVIVAALVARTFNTSMEVAVVVESEDMRTGVRHHCCSAHLTFVVRPHAGAGSSSSAAAAAVLMPSVCPTTPEHRAVWEGAEVRRQARLERRTRARRSPELRDAERLCRLQPITHREGGPTLPPALTLAPRKPQRPSTATPAPNSSTANGAVPATATTLATTNGRQLVAPTESLIPRPVLHQPCPSASALDTTATITTTATASTATVAVKSYATGSVGAAAVAAAPAAGNNSDRAASGAARTGNNPCDSHGGAAAELPGSSSSGDGSAGARAAEEASTSAGPAWPLRVYPAVRPLVPPGCTTAYMTQSIMPQHANTLNITFGGQVMSWIEQCAYISASRLRAAAMLTAAMDSVSFVRPTRVGDILYITAQVSAIFGSSLEVMVSVFGESPFALVGSGGGGGSSGGRSGGASGDGGSGGTGSCGDIFHCADAYVTVVAVDEQTASPVQVPFELDPRDPADVLRYQGAQARRAERLALRGQFAAAETTRMSLDGALLYSPPSEVAEGAGSVLEGMPPL